MDQDDLPDKIAVLISFSGAGGVERMVMNLVRQFVSMGVQVDLLLIRASSPHLAEMPAGVNQLPLKAQHTSTAVREIADYLRAHRPAVMLVAKDRAGRAALKARRKAGVNTAIVIRLGTNLSTALAGKPALVRWARTGPMRGLYAQADAVIAVSEGVRQDTLEITGMDPARVLVVRNPVVTGQMQEASRASVEHPWLQDPPSDRNIPVLIAAGRLSRQKGFDDLLSAFALIRKNRPLRLIILGEGDDRSKLQQQIEQLKVSGAVSMPGFQKNLYAWIAKADVFVLSSRWEGSPNVLTEALALGIPCVSTRCPSGPDETLQEGKYGPLVDVGDIRALAAAIESVLAAPLAGEFLQQAVTDYFADVSARRYLAVLKQAGQG